MVKYEKPQVQLIVTEEDVVRTSDSSSDDGIIHFPNIPFGQ